MDYVEFKEYDTIIELLEGYDRDYLHPLYVIFNNIIVFIYKKSRI